MKPSRIAILLFVTSSLLMSTACAPVLIGSAAVTGVS
ncbi:phospholipid-binding protein, partial [Phocaeicola vulgatus]